MSRPGRRLLALEVAGLLLWPAAALAAVPGAGLAESLNLAWVLIAAFIFLIWLANRYPAPIGKPHRSYRGEMR